MSSCARSILLAMLLAGLALGVHGTVVRAQEPPNIEAQALSIEKQLLCPQCTNERLDVCETAICVDMRKEIRKQLAEGRNSDEIILFFRDRYGQRVLADLPKEGFNLVLFGWVGGSILVMALGGAYFLTRLRASGRAHRAELAGTPPAAADDDEAWLDAEFSEGDR